MEKLQLEQNFERAQSKLDTDVMLFILFTATTKYSVGELSITSLLWIIPMINVLELFWRKYRKSTFSPGAKQQNEPILKQSTVLEYNFASNKYD